MSVSEPALGDRGRPRVRARLWRGLGRALPWSAACWLAAALATMGLAAERRPLLEEYITVSYGVDAGVPQPIEQVLQTSDGYLWAATQVGLVRFDGMRFQRHRVTDTPGLSSSTTYALHEDRAGNLWIGTRKGLVRHSAGRFELVALEDRIVETLAEDAAGTLWIGTSTGLYRRFQDGRVESLEHEPLLGRKRIRSMMVEPGGRVWVAAQDTPLLVYRHGSFQVAEIEGQTVPEPVSLARTSDGTVWVATNSDGVFRLRENELRRYGTADGLTSDETMAVFVDRSDRVWVSSFGLWLFGRERPERFGLALPRMQENFRAMAEDREGNLWIGTIADGLIRVRGTGFRLISRDHGLPGRVVKSVMEDSTGHLWLSVERESPVRLSPDGTVRQFSVEEGYGVDIRSFAEGTDGSIWIGCRRFLQVWRNGVAETFPEYASVRAMFRDSTGAMWIGRDDAPVLRYRDGLFEEMGGIGGMPAGTAVTFAEDHTGAVYIGFARQGLAKFSNGTVTTMTTAADGLPADELRAIYSDRAGHLWIGTKGRGLAVLADGRWLNPQAFADAMEDTVCAIIEDDGGRLFLGTAKGVIAARKADVLAMARGGAAARFHLLNVTDGVRSGDVWSAFQPVVWKARSGELWFATRQGLVGVNPHYLPANHVPPPVKIEGVVVDGREVPLAGEGIELAPGTVTIRFDYTALSFARPQQVRFKYKLEGWDNDWVDAGTQREARYTHLPPDRYRFRVIAANEDGVWNEVGASLSVHQKPWFHQTPWFFAAVGLVSLGTIGIFHRRHTRSLRREKTRLEQRVAERTAELAQSYETLRVSEYFYHSLVESLPQIIARKDAAGRYTYVNTAFAKSIGRAPEEIVGRDDAALRPEKAAKESEEDRRVMASRDPIQYEEIVEDAEGHHHLHVKKVPLVDDRRQPIGVQLLAWDITSVRETEEKLRVAQRELLETSRLAGIAEIATGVLHNIGNALNSVNVSTSVLAGRVRHSKGGNVERLAQLLPSEPDALRQFYASDPRALLLPRYFTELAASLRKENQDVSEELEALRERVDHIKEIVAAQQGFARVSAITEEIPAVDLAEFALRMSDASLARHGIAVVRDFADTPIVNVARQKVLQILVNVIRNAVDALDHAPGGDRRLRIGIRVIAGDRVRFEVQDSGPGIAPENLTRVFEFGFTTKKEGHGFGLHSSAVAATEMGGSLIAASEGLGRGATFVLELPVGTRAAGHSASPLAAS